MAKNLRSLQINISQKTLRTAMFAVVLIAVYSWAVAPHVNYLYAVHKYKSLAGNITKQNESLEDDLYMLKTEYEDLQSEITDLKDTMVTEDEFKGIVDNVQVDCDASGCAMYSITTTDGAVLKGDKAIGNVMTVQGRHLNVSVVGKYGNVIAFLEALRKYSNKMWIETFEIVPLYEGTTVLKCNVTGLIQLIREVEQQPQQQQEENGMETLDYEMEDHEYEEEQ